MSESQSRYSIIENLTKEKVMAEQRIADMTLDEKQRLLTRKRLEQEFARTLQDADEDYVIFQKHIERDRDFQERKIVEIDKAIASISKISQAVEKQGMY